MPAYLIFEVDITDPEAWAAYREVGGPVMAASGGRFLVNSSTAQMLEGGWSPPTISVVEFPDMATARAFYDSDAYQRTIPLRQKASTAKGILVDGFVTRETPR